MANAMRTVPLIPTLALSLAVLAGCGPNPSDPGPGGVTVSEAEALDDAAEMLEQRRQPAAVEPSATATATGESTQ